MCKYLSGFLKYFFYKRVSFLTLIDVATKIHSTARIYSGCRLINSRIDAFSYISYKSTLVNVTVGKFCSIASGVYIGLDAHNLNGVSTSPIFYTPHNALDISWVNNSFFDDSHKEVIIGNDVWIGTKVVIKGGITIGDGAVIGACAVVTKDVPPYSICAGIPAKIIRYRFSPEDIQFLQKEEWWNLSPNLLKENAMHFNSGDISFLRDLCR